MTNHHLGLCVIEARELGPDGRWRREHLWAITVSAPDRWVLATMTHRLDSVPFHVRTYRCGDVVSLAGDGSILDVISRAAPYGADLDYSPAQWRRAARLWRPEVRYKLIRGAISSIPNTTIEGCGPGRAVVNTADLAAVEVAVGALPFSVALTAWHTNP